MANECWNVYNSLGHNVENPCGWSTLFCDINNYQAWWDTAEEYAAESTRINEWMQSNDAPLKARQDDALGKVANDLFIWRKNLYVEHINPNEVKFNLDYAELYANPKSLVMALATHCGAAGCLVAKFNDRLAALEVDTQFGPIEQAVDEGKSDYADEWPTWKTVLAIGGVGVAVVITGGVLWSMADSKKRR